LSIDGQGYFLIDEINVDESCEFTMEDINIFRYPFILGISINQSYSWPGQVEAHIQPTQRMAYAGITGHQLYTWYKNNKYCGCCGKNLIKDLKERMLHCNSCNNMVYPRLNPAVIVGVTHKNRIILSRYNRQPKNTYALVAGFIEFGESLEEGVKREVLEEVGLHVTNIRYYKSQPWPFTSSLLMGFYCDVINGDEDIVLDPEELSLAQWFEREDIPVEFNNISLTNEMIVAFKNGEV
jgi:NAD+ diphosphatase